MIPVISFIQHTASCSLMDEVGTTPKPGLVDRLDNGAHTDMCYDTFAVSTEAIVPYLGKMALLGYEWHSSLDQLFPAIRPIGIQAEQAMFQATGGVNTHKGLIFSLGILCAAAGFYYKQHRCFHGESILSLCGLLTEEWLERDFQSIDLQHPKTHGEKLFTVYGCKGIRGEVQGGFESVRRYSLPFIRSFSAACSDFNVICIQTLLTLMSHVDDTNILIRSNPETLSYVKLEASRLLSLGGATSKQGLLELSALNEDFIRRNISPGGCADLLAVTIFIWKLEQYKEEEHETNQ